MGRLDGNVLWRIRTTKTAQEVQPKEMNTLDYSGMIPLTYMFLNNF